jgi:heme/copper-type cytochrome/quinol oxidase subunit 1
VSLYFVILLGLGLWGYLCNILNKIRVFCYKYMLIASKQFSCCLLLVFSNKNLRVKFSLYFH